MKTIHLHGSLKEQFGGPFRLDVRSPGEAITALTTQLPGLRHALAPMRVKVIRGREVDNGWEMDLDQLSFMGGKHYHIVPVIHGAGGGSAGKVIAGVALIAIAVVAPYALGLGAYATGAAFSIGTSLAAGTGLGFTFGSIALMGGALILSGVAMALSPAPKATSAAEREAPDERPSFVFNGPVNTAEQGGPVPLVYGRHIVGSHVISAGLSSVGVPVDNNTPSGNSISGWITGRNPLA